MTPTEAVKMLRSAVEIGVEHLNSVSMEERSADDRVTLAVLRDALAATAEPAATCSCGFPRTAGYPRRACEACGRAATAEPATLVAMADCRACDGTGWTRGQRLVGCKVCGANAEPAKCSTCGKGRDENDICSNGFHFIAPTYSADDLRKVAEAVRKSMAHEVSAKEHPQLQAALKRMYAPDLDAIIAKAVK